ncbi:MAG: FapA family protein [Candidatus Electryonea clarkiae]|nr:FapA family protein [Candidatus Electryonea clarkiae]MDP8287314.1 FapA family protein [Candidatus Electryonea clarkiae]
MQESTEINSSPVPSQDKIAANGSVRCTIALSSNAVDAHAVIIGPEGEEFDPKLILDALKSEKVRVGINKNAIAQLASKNGIRGQAVLVAQGRDADPGANSEIKYLFNTKPKPKPIVVDEWGKVNFRETGILQVVNPGDVLAERTLPTKGKPGVTVIGIKISSQSGKNIPIKNGDNTSFTDSLETQLVSNTVGFAKLNSQKEIEVSETYVVENNVDLNTGNICFDGNVIVKGDVLNGFRIDATKDVEIKGVVEDAQIHCGGDLIIRGGFIGTEKGNIYVAGETHIRFMENQNLVSSGDVYIAEEIVHSKIKTGGSVFIKYGKGAIIGGEIIAEGCIEGKIIGNQHYARTELIAGHCPELDILEVNIRKAIKQSDSTKNLIQIAVSKMLENKYKSDNFTSEQENILQQLYDYNYNYDKNIKELEDSLQGVIDKYAKIIKHGYVIASQHVFPGVSIKIDTAIKLLDKDHDRKKFIYSNGKIEAVQI